MALRFARLLAVLAGSGTLALSCAAASAVAASVPTLQAVSYAGYRFDVPASWPVINLAQQPQTCVRFDLHAVYLGTPAANESCPGWLLGTTEAILIQPAPAGLPRQSAENLVTNQITASAPGIAVSATFDTNPAEIVQILASAGWSAPRLTAAAPAGRGGPARELTNSAAPVRDAGAASSPVPPPELPATVANDVGLGFDTCTAPSSGAMQAWLLHSPYRAVGIYIGGADSACDQPNLTAAWVREQAAAGWGFIPMYAGPQAALGQLTSPAQQGAADAADAVAQARGLGFGPGTPLYYDMESYPPDEAGPVIAFLAAWTIQLHRLGYDAGVYASSDSGVADLAQSYQSGSDVTPDVIFDALWNGQANTADSHYLPGEWTGGRRLHQFSGNASQSFGGVTMVIDQDYLDVTLPVVGGTTQPSSAVVTPGGSTAVFYASPTHQLIEDSASGASAWTRTDLGGDVIGAPSVVEVGASTVDVFYLGGDGDLVEVASSGAGWLPPQPVSQLGQVGAPEAVAQPNGVIDVFWRGPQDGSLWLAQYDPGLGWAGPQDLGGTVDGLPDPVEQPSGQLQVFWRGAVYGSLWRVVRGAAGTWSSPQDLGVGVLGGQPAAVALPTGEIDVFWRGLGQRYVWWTVLLPGASPAQPTVPAGSAGVGQPWPALAAGGEWLLFEGRFGGLQVTTRPANGEWPAPVPVAGISGLAAAPFAAAGPEPGPLAVFWMGLGDQLWTAEFTEAAGWSVPVALG
ncbi:MAG TPA: glycoside hydrolase domain-containing protein [Streptosporangiaceae bacterium]|nr:glycoside hydrolase domain-containing protein [Streptosporangiaceae bacterium]